VFDDLAGLILQLNDTLTWFLFQLKSGLTSAPRLPHARQIRRGSISHSLTSSGHWLILIAIERLQTSTRRTQPAHFDQGDFSRAVSSGHA
jgi:hypothetical protein